VNIKNSQEYWDDIYTKNRPNDLSWFQKEPSISLNLIQRLSDNKAQLIDIGGGASVLTDCLRVEGYAIIATFAKEGPRKCSGLDIVQYDDISIQQELGGEFALIEHQSEIHLTPKGNEQRFNYFLFQRRKRVT